MSFNAKNKRIISISTQKCSRGIFASHFIPPPIKLKLIENTEFFDFWHHFLKINLIYTSYSLSQKKVYTFVELSTQN